MKIHPWKVSPTSEEQKTDIEVYALAKGHKSTVSFLLFAAVSYMAKYPINEAQEAKAKAILEKQIEGA